MRSNTMLFRMLSATVGSAMILALPGTTLAAPAKHGPVRPSGPRTHYGERPAGTIRPTSEVTLSTGQGELINLPADVTDVWVSAPDVADVYVNSARQIHLFGKAFGEATMFATNASGGVVYSTNIRVSQNLTSIDRMVKLAMPESDITVTTVGQIAVLTGTVPSPAESEQAQQLVTGLLNPGVNVSTPGASLKIGVINRLRAATPLQVNLQVRIAEVSRSFVKTIGVNFGTVDQSSGLKFGITQGRGAATQFSPGGPLGTGFTQAPTNGSLINSLAGSGTVALAGKLLGLDLISSLDLGERDGQVTTLANPNLTAISGETGSFLAGGEIPIPVSQGLGAVSVEYKQYGVSLSYTPTVLADGRISLRVRPEVSQLSSQGAVSIGGTTIPAVTTRRAETTVELGSGQSMMIAGLLSNSHNNSITKTPGLGDVPIAGALFRNNEFNRQETELVIVITPYLVKPVNANDIVLPTDGYKAPTDLGRVFLGQLGGGKTGGDRPKPSVAPGDPLQPAFGAVASATLQPAPVQPASVLGLPTPSAPLAMPRGQQPMTKPKQGAAAPAPGFSLN